MTVIRLADRRQTLHRGGGGGTFGGMEQRVKTLEDKFDRMEVKIDAILTDLSFIKGQLSGMPSATTFGDISGRLGKLEGRVDSLPTTAKAAALLGIAIAAMTFILKFHEIMAFARG